MKRAPAGKQGAGSTLGTVLGHWTQMLLVEDNSARAQRRRIAGVAATNGVARVTVRVHRIRSAGWEILAEGTYRAGALKRRAKDGGKATVALELIDGIRSRRRGTVITAGPTYGCNASFLAGLADRGLDYVVEVRPSTQLRLANRGASARASVPAGALLKDRKWKGVEVPVPNAAGPLEYRVAPLADVRLPDGDTGCLFAAQTGGIPGIHRGTIFGLASTSSANVASLLRVIGWARWIRPAIRREERRSVSAATSRTESKQDRRRAKGPPLTVRANITLARQQDKQAADQQSEAALHEPSLRGVLASLSAVLNVVELFAGAGGMGLGFLLAGQERRRYRLVFSGEVDPIFVETLRRNHEAVCAQLRAKLVDCVPEDVEPIDLRSAEAFSLLRRVSKQAGGVHILIGGPPCQGFSNANRNSWHSANPHNRLIDVFLHHVELLRPPVFLLENVQGILWTPKGGQPSGPVSVVEHIGRRMAAAGYEVFPKLLDAVWYGVPQYRSRFFLLGLRRDLGYRREDFSPWGPFPLPTHGPGCPRPYVTVRDAIADLPRIRNGDDAAQRMYREPSRKDLRSNPFLASMRSGAVPGVIVDHVTSRHAQYVIERYRRIPQGGNWQDIADALTNYADVERTHSNIYRRLKWDEPSITIGHYRKSMLVHPSQHRGLSLREASRLQSFPDWFRFSGSVALAKDGIVHKQQQLANAVCPLVTKALAEFILRL